jgi:hypothetical protein
MDMATDAILGAQAGARTDLNQLEIRQPEPGMDEDGRRTIILNTRGKLDFGPGKPNGIKERT